jgi:hypothetical protein
MYALQKTHLLLVESRVEVRYCSGYQGLGAGLPRFWRRHHDGRITSSRQGHQALVLRSPLLFGASQEV